MRTPKRLVSGSTLTTGLVTYYTAPTNTRAIIRRATFANSSALAATVTVHLVPSGGSASVANQIVRARALGAGEVWSAPDLEGHVLEAGGTLQASASAASAISLVASGVEIV